MLSLRGLLAFGLAFAFHVNGAIVQPRPTVLDEAVSSTLDGSVKGTWRATVSSKRKQGVTKEEFSRRWARHGRKLAGPLAVKYDCISYVQHHLPASYAAAFKDKLDPVLNPDFPFSDIDGIVTLLFRNGGDLAGFFNDPAHNETLNADVAEFADPMTVQFSVGYELPIVQGGKLLA